MKQIIMYLMALTTIVIIGSGCKKQGNTNTDDNNVPGLPPATQVGANTFGFLLNGQPWIPQGNDGSGNNLSMSYDPRFNNGVVGITAYKATPTLTFTQGFGIGIKDSLNFFSFPKTFILSRTSLFRAGGNQDALCTMFSTDLGTFCNGQLTIDKLDRQNRIIAGRFNFTLHQNGCDTVKVTNGRFDMKF